MESYLPPEWEQADPQETQLEPNWTNGVGGLVTKNADNITVAHVLDRWISTRESGTWNH